MTKRRYWVQVEGSKIYRATESEIRKLSQRLADTLGRALQVGYDEPPAGFRRNPDPADILGHTSRMLGERQARDARFARRMGDNWQTGPKVRHLTKSLREGRAAVVQREERAFKTGKFVVTASGGPKGKFELARPNRAAADALADAFRAEGYKVTVSPI